MTEADDFPPGEIGTSGIYVACGDCHRQQNLTGQYVPLPSRTKLYWEARRVGYVKDHERGWLCGPCYRDRIRERRRLAAIKAAQTRATKALAGRLARDGK